VTVLVVTEHRPDLSPTPDVDASGGWTRGAPVTILRIYVVLLVLIPPTYIVEPLGGVGTPATVVALVALMLWGVGLLAPGTHLCRTVVPVRVVMGLFVATTFLSYAVAHVRYVPAVELLASDRALLQLFGWAGVVLLAAEGLRDREELYRVLRVFVAAVAVMALVGLFQFRFGIDFAENVKRIPGLHQNADLVSIQDRSGFRRPAGTATHPIEFGCVIAMTLPLALHLARFDLARSAARRWFPVAAILIGIPVAVSRSAVLASLVAAIVIFIGLDPRIRPRALAVAAGFIVLTYATTPGLLGTLGGLFVNAGSDSSISYRTGDYSTVGEFIQQSPLLGRGPGTFVAGAYIILDNQYLLTAIEIGLVGLAVVIGYLLAAAFLGRGARHASKEPAIRDLGQALAATSLASAVAAITFDAFSFLMFAGVVPLGLGIAGGLWKLTRVAKRQGEAAPPFDDGSPDGRPEPHVQPVHAVPPGDPDWTNGADRVVDLREADPDRGRPLEPVAPVGGRDDSPSDSPLADFVGGVPGPTTTRSDARRRATAVGVGIGAVVLGGLVLGVGRGSADDPEVAGARVVTGPLSMPTSTSTTVPPGDTAASPPAEATATRPRIIAMAETDTDTAPMVRPLRTDPDVAVMPPPRSTGSTSPPTPPSTGSPTTTHPTTPPTAPPTTSPPTTAPPTTAPPTTAPPTTSPPTTEPPATTTTTVAAAVPDPEPPPPPPP
jgi:polysaccharide biosynthesis protein PslJ